MVKQNTLNTRNTRNTIEKGLFSARLNTLADEAQIKQRGRSRILGELFGSGQKGANRWLTGDGFPTLQKCIEISLHFGVHLEWLMTGRGAKNVLAKDDPYLSFVNIFTSLPCEIKNTIVVFASTVMEGDQKKMEGLIQCLELSGTILQRPQ